MARDADGGHGERRLPALLVAAALFIGFAYFYQAGGWNQNSRFDLVRAVVERGTLHIDAYVRNTGDRARCGGHGEHVCSDKAPGLALAAVPPAAAARAFTSDLAVSSYFATLVTAALPAALAGLLLLLIAVQLGASRGGAAVAALVFGLGSPMWCYATLLFGHALAAGCLVAAFAAALALGREAAGENDARRLALFGLAIGLAAGWATITEYPSAVPAAIIAALALWLVRERGWAAVARVAAGIGVGAAACIATLFVYNHAAFGAALHVGYANVEGFGGMHQGFLGVTYPKAHVLGEILFGRYRGLFFLAPALALGPIGLALLVRRPDTRAAGVAAAAIVGYYVLFNASYFYWDGGWSYGPRHLSPGIAFLALGLAPLWTRARPALRAGLAALAIYGGALTLVAVSTTAQPSDAVKHPVGDLLWPAFRAGELALNRQSIDQIAPAAGQPRAAWNLGEKLGLHGHTSLVPLALALAGIAVAGYLTSRRRSLR